MLLNKSLVVAASLLTSVSLSAALAADLPQSTPAPAPVVEAPPVFTWTGFYVGAHAGYAWGSNSLTNTSPPGPPTRTVSIKPDGFMGGVQAGYDWQLGSFVLGAVADLSLVSLSKSFNSVPPPGPPFLAKASVDWMSTLRVRAGVLATQRLLAYVHGGLAVANIKGSWVGGPWNGSGSSTRAGWVAGAGLEYRISPNVSTFLEYSYADLGKHNFANVGGPAVTFSHSTKVQSIKLGLNYRFGGPAGAVTAKY